MNLVLISSLLSKQERPFSSPVESPGSGNTEDADEKDENTKRSGGGDLREGKEGFKRLFPTVARLTFVSSRGIVFS